MPESDDKILLPIERFAASEKGKRSKVAGEVRFIKDRSGDKGEWAWGSPGPSEREMDAQFRFQPRAAKPLASSLRSTLMALGHAMSAQQTFTKIKSATVSPDGSLGGKGYIQKIADMRRQYANCVEVLSALSDTIYDEINAPHWNPAIEEDLSGRDREEVKQILDDAEEIKDDPEGWAEEEEAEMDEEGGGKQARAKTASTMQVQVPGSPHTYQLEPVKSVGSNWRRTVVWKTTNISLPSGKWDLYLVWAGPRGRGDAVVWVAHHPDSEATFTVFAPDWQGAIKKLRAGDAHGFGRAWWDYDPIDPEGWAGTGARTAHIEELYYRIRRDR